MPNPLLCTPAQLWTLALNRARLTPAAFDPGTISDVAHTGTGTGILRVTDLPYDNYFVEAAISRSGDTVPKIGPVIPAGKIAVIGTPAGNYSLLVEIMAVGFFRYSTNGGVSYSATLPIAPEVVLTGTGLSLCFLAPVSVGDSFTCTTIGLGQASVTIYNVSTPLGQVGTGQVYPSGSVSKPYRIAVAFVCADKFVYSVNGGEPTEPMPIGDFTIPCVGIRIHFLPGCGPTTYSCGDTWVISTRGSTLYTLSDQPIPLARPEQTGLRLVFDAAVTSPNFVAGDLYSFSTTAPPDIVDACQAGSDELLASLMARYQKQVLLDWDQSVTVNAARIITATLYERKGLNQKEDQTYRDAADKAREWGVLVGSKKRHPRIVAMPLPGVLAPRVLLGQDLEGVNEGPFGPDLGAPWGPGILRNF